MIVLPRSSVLLLALGLTTVGLAGCAHNDGSRYDEDGNNSGSQYNRNQYGADDRYRGENRAWNNATGKGDQNMGAQPGARYADNDNCPVKGGKVSRSLPTAEWRGKKVGFCCGGCQERWNAMGEAEKESAFAKTR